MSKFANQDSQIARLWSEGLTRPEIALKTGASLPHIRYVVEQGRKIEQAEEARYKRDHVDGARSEIGALAKANHLSYTVVYGRFKAGKRGDDLIAPVRPWGMPKPHVKGVALVHALSADMSPLNEATIEMIALAKFNRWSTAKICQAFDVHPRQVQVIQAKSPVPLDEMHWNVAGEMLKIKEIAAKTSMSVEVVKARIRRGWRGLELLQPLQRGKKDNGV